MFIDFTKELFAMTYPQLLIDSIFQHIPSYVFWKDTRSIYLGCNQHFADFVGLARPTDIIGKTDYDIGWLADGADKFQQGDQATLAGLHVKNEEEWLAVKGGHKVLVLVNKVPLLDATNQVVGVLGVATDITEKKKLHEHLAQIKYQLRGMMILSASISHELRTPLAALKNASLGIEQVLPQLITGYE